MHCGKTLIPPLVSLLRSIVTPSLIYGLTTHAHLRCYTKNRVFRGKETPQKNVCACVGQKKDGEEFKCQIVNKNMAI
jgi:hypothetical protein